MTREPKQRLMNSKVALQILQILSKGEQKYARQLAEELERPQDSIHTYVKLLREENLIERGKRTQAQYYKINYEGIATFCIDIVTDGLEEIMEDTSDPKWVETALLNIHENDAKFTKNFIEDYVKYRISDSEDETINEFFFHKMYYDIDTTFLLNSDLQSEEPQLRWLRTALAVYIGKGKGQDISNIL